MLSVMRNDILRRKENDMRLFDLHCDTLYRAFTENGSFNDDRFHISYNKVQEIDPYIQCMAVWIPDEYRGDAAKKLFSGCLAKFREELAKNNIRQCRTSEDITALSKNGGRGVILTVELSQAAHACGKIQRCDLGVAAVKFSQSRAILDTESGELRVV